jgi:hypothetical protein
VSVPQTFVERTLTLTDFGVPMPDRRKESGKLKRVSSANPSLQAAEEQAALDPSVHRVFEPTKPRFQLRPGEEGLSVFDAQSVNPEDVLPHFRPGSQITTQEIQSIESQGLKVVCPFRELRGLQ